MKQSQRAEHDFLLHPKEYELLKKICEKLGWTEDKGVEELVHEGLEFLQEHSKQVVGNTGANPDDVVRAILLPGQRTQKPGLSENDVVTGALVFGIGLKAKELGFELDISPDAPEYLIVDLPTTK